MPSNLELAARVNDILPEGDWVAAVADESAWEERLQALAELAWPDLEVVMSAPGGLRLTSSGPEGLRETWADWLGAFDSYGVGIEDLREAGDRVVVLVRHWATPKGTDASIEGSAAGVMTFREGRLARIEFNLDRAEALRDAGLDPAGQRPSP